MATVDDYSDMQYFEAFKNQFSSLNPDIDIRTPLGTTAYLSYLNFLQNRRLCLQMKETIEILQTKKLP